jgi:hypothetical protein
MMYAAAKFVASSDMTERSNVSGLRRSLLLDDYLPAIQSEKHVPANDKSARGFEVVDDIKAALFRCTQKSKFFRYLFITSIFGLMHEVVNIGKKITNYTV